MPYFLIHPGQIEGNKASLTDDEARHLIKVLRHKTGDRIWLSDGKHQYLGVIESIGPKEVVLKLLESHPLTPTAPSPVLGISLLKHDHLERVLQKGVELGVSEFLLFVSERTIPHYHESATPKKMTRFEKIAAEAAKQSGIVSIPKIHPPLPFEKFLKKIPEFSSCLLAWEEEKESSFHATFQTIDPARLLVLIGPEGGFAQKEVGDAQKNGAKIVSLGRRILRCETAAIVTLSLCQYELGNI